MEHVVARLVPEFLERAAARHPDKVALVAARSSVTYAEFDRRASRVAHALRARGVKRGDRVLIQGDNVPDVAVAIFAALKADAVFVVVGAQVKSDKLAYMLADAGASAFIGEAMLYPAWTEALARSPVPCVLVFGDDAPLGRALDVAKSRGLPGVEALEVAEWGGGDAPPVRRGVDTDTAMIIYTSGSTGEPKGAMLSHRNVEFASWSVTTLIENTADDVIFGVVPLAFNYGLYQLLMSVRLGATLVMERSFSFPVKMLERIRDAKVTGFAGVPTMFAMLGELRDVAPMDLSSVRYVTSTAAPMLPRHVEAIRRWFPNAKIYSMYGLTECKRVSWLPPADIDRKPGCVGLPIPGTEFRVVDEEGHARGVDQPGELVVRGSHIMQGYWRKPEVTARYLRPGPTPHEVEFYTGDLCRIDAEGHLYFIARMDEVIKTRGEKVAPQEVEAALARIEGVLECAVIGVDDALLGAAVKAYLVLADSHRGKYTEREIQVRCAAMLENYMVPRHVEFADALPKTAMGKILKKALAQRT